MKWCEDDIDLLLKLIKSGKSYKEISGLMKRSESSIRTMSHRHGEKSSSYYESKKIKIVCGQCRLELEDLESRNRKFCSQSCNAKFNNKLRLSKPNQSINCFCLNCNITISSKKFCSKKCQFDFQKNEIFTKIENGDNNFTDRVYKKYLISKFGEKCMSCGWCEVNKKTNKIPIQLEHIDGHSENNSLDNLKLLCPNCHSLTSTYGSLNKGNGRKNRHKK